MALFNHATKEVTAKLVYYGPGLCGKTTNLQWIHDHVPVRSKGKLVSLATASDRTLFFDFLPVELGTVRGMKTRVQIYTVPGQVFYESTRRMVLRGADAVVFVADSQEAILDANKESLESLRRNLAENKIDSLPMVVQYNKRDLPTALAVDVLNDALNAGRLPHFEAIASTGKGVEDTLKAITKLLFASLASLYAAADEPRPADPDSSPRAIVARIPPTAPAPTSEEPLALGDVFAPEPSLLPSPGTSRRPTRPASATPPPDLARDPDPQGDGLKANEWVYLLDGRQRGPLDFEDLVDLILTSLPESTKVWRPGLPGWTAANAWPAIAEHIPPPLPNVRAEEDFPDFDTVPEMLRTVLIADEDSAFRKFLAMPLAAQGFTIWEAVDGDEAWSLAVEHRPWLILADSGLPEMDGFELCRRVRAHPLISHTPLLFVSNSDTYKERSRAQQVGSDEFFTKQTPIRELLMRIQLVMTRYSDLGAAGRLGGRPGEASSLVGGALEGRLEVFGTPGVLQICNQGGLTGIFTARTEDNLAAVFGFKDGEIISATTGEQKGPEAVYAFLAWTSGAFKFTPGDPGEGKPIAATVEHLLLEGCRLLDESRRDPA